MAKSVNPTQFDEQIDRSSESRQPRLSSQFWVEYEFLGSVVWIEECYFKERKWIF